MLGEIADAHFINEETKSLNGSVTHSGPPSRQGLEQGFKSQVDLMAEPEFSPLWHCRTLL